MWWESCEKIHCGFWNNHETHSGQSTLTLPTQWAIILSAFLALFIRLSGSYLWAIICFILHQVKATSANRDDIYHQVQVALRNTDTESSLAWKLFRVGAVHKGSRTKAFGRTYWLILLALLHASGIGIIGGLSSRLIAGSDAVLAVEGKCGWMSEIAENATTHLADEIKNSDENFAIFNALVVMARYGYRRSAGYARSCYAQTSDNSSNACEIYIQPTLPYNVSFSEPCPFGGDLCNGTTMTVDMNGLRSDTDLGINTLPESAVTLRQTWTCSPIDAQPYATKWGNADELKMNVSTDGSWNDEGPRDEERICYKFGTDLAEKSSFLFCLTRNALNYGETAYDVKSETSFVNYTGSYAPTFKPIPVLDIQDADVTLLSLVSRITYPEKILDPWFSATIEGNGTNNVYGRKGYTATYPRSFLGCRQRYQLCTIDRSYCSPYTGLYGIRHGDDDLKDLNPTQRAVFQLTWKMIWFTQLNFQLIFISRENLIANDYLWDGGSQFGLSAALPDDHWRTEVSNFFNVSLAALQRAGPAFAQPPSFDIGDPKATNDTDIQRFIRQPVDAEMRRLCANIKMKSKAHTSFNVLGLGLLIGLGVLIMLTEMLLPRGVAMWQTRSGSVKGQVKRLDWIESGMFQLQRMAAEGRGVVPWQGKEADVPTLVGGEVFNLSGMSLRGKGGEAVSVFATGYEGYRAVRPEEEMETSALKGDMKGRVSEARW